MSTTITLYPVVDTYINSDNPNTNYSSSASLVVGNDTNTSGFNRSLLRFNLASIPSNAYVTSATLYLYNTGGLTYSVPVSVYPLFTNWTDTETTWYAKQGTATPILWAFAGASGVGSDYITPPYATTTISNTPGWVGFSLDSLLRDWVWNYVDNYGVILSEFDTSFATNTKSFHSSNYGTPSLRPYLSVTYILAPDIPDMVTEPYYTKGTSNTIYWSDESGTGAVEYYPVASLTNTFSSLITIEHVERTEDVVSQTSTTLKVAYCVDEVYGVWLNSSKTGTNYFFSTGATPLPGTYTRNNITLQQALPNPNTPVYVEYRGNGWTTQLQQTFSNLNDSTTYFYRVKARNAIGAETKWSSYVYSTQDDQIDTLELITPVGNEVWNGRTTKYIQWKALDNTSGLIDNTSIYRSSDSGATWVLLADSQPNVTALANEATTSVTKTRLYTQYQIQDVVGVWLASDTGKTGTNYYLVSGATPLPNAFYGREIILGTELPELETDVIIDYDTFGFYQWQIPNNYDSENSRIKVIVEDSVGNTKEIISDKDFTIITILNRLTPVFNTSDSSYVTKIIKSFKSELEIQNQNTTELKRLFNITTAESSDLDLHGQSVQVFRRTNESDKDYRARIIAAIVAIKNTKQSIINAVAPFCLTSPYINEWASSDNIFYLDYSYLDWINVLGAGFDYGNDPFTWEIWVEPKDNSFNTFLGIIQTIDRFKPAGTLSYIRLPAIGTLYGTDYYANFYYSYILRGGT